METFRTDSYRTFRNASFLAGFFGSMVPLWMLIGGRHLGIKDVLLSELLVIGLMVVFAANHLREYVALDGKHLVLQHLFTRKEIPVDQISEVAFRFTGMALMAYVSYESAGVSQTATQGMDFMSTANIEAISERLKVANPRIQITADWLSKDQQKNNARYFRTPPSGVLGWVTLVGGWLLTGILAQLFFVIIFGLNSKSST